MENVEVKILNLKSANILVSGGAGFWDKHLQKKSLALKLKQILKKDLKKTINWYLSNFQHPL